MFFLHIFSIKKNEINAVIDIIKYVSEQRKKEKIKSGNIGPCDAVPGLEMWALYYAWFHAPSQRFQSKRDRLYIKFSVD